MDGIDAVLASFTDHGATTLHAALTHPYSEPLRERLAALAGGEPVTAAAFGTVDIEVAREFAAAVRALLKEAGNHPALRAIGSHGQTIMHVPAAPAPFSLQLGNPATLAVLTGLPVVADFRNADMALGGQGAPLTPAFHQAVFACSEQERVVLNIGGIANLTMLPPDRPVTAFDTGPGNTLLDGWCQRHLGRPFDANGDWAADGAVDQQLLERLLADPYFQAPPPKSTGTDYFNLPWLERGLAGLEQRPAPQDVQATLAELTAVSIAHQLEQHSKARDIGICGGGVCNQDLRRRLAARLPGRQLASTLDWGIAPEWVEGAAFAWLARERIHERPGNLPAVTGASRATPLGGLWLPPAAAG